MTVSITSLKAFETAARHLNCSRAAEELFLTQSAVSKKIRLLEEQLEVVLFLRVPQGLLLTDAGRAYVETIRPILRQLSLASERMRDFRDSPNVLNLGAPSTLAQKWLIPRFPSFVKANPTVKVILTPRTTKQPHDGLHLDAEICSDEEPHWDGLDSNYVIGREYVVVCSPALRDQLKPTAAKDLLDQMLMGHVQVPMAWHDWFADAGLSSSLAGRPPVTASHYEQYSVMIPAVTAGMGFGIVPLFLVLDELRSGELIIPFEQSTLRKGYSLIYRTQRRNFPVLQAFRTWLLTEAKKTEFECTEIKRQKLM